MKCLRLPESLNIGNAFFNIGAEWILRKASEKVHFFPENPRWTEDVPQHYNPVSDIDVDLVILAGPCLWSRIDYMYGSRFERLYQQGISLSDRG